MSQSITQSIHNLIDQSSDQLLNELIIQTITQSMKYLIDYLLKNHSNYQSIIGGHFNINLEGKHYRKERNLLWNKHKYL